MLRPSLPTRPATEKHIARPDAIAASFAGTPAIVRAMISSTMTTPLSTNRPKAMMIAAIETCSRAMPSARMARKENRTANGTIMAATTPARRPRKKMTSPATTTTGLHHTEESRTDGGLDLLRLVGRKIDRVSDRKFVLIRPRRNAKPSAKLCDVLVRLHDNAEHDRRTPIEIHRLDLRRDIVAPNSDEVAQSHQSVGGADSRKHLFNGANIRKIARTFEQYARALRIDRSGRQDDVLPLQIRDQDVQLNADGGKLFGVDFKPDTFVLNAEKLHLGHTR